MALFTSPAFDSLECQFIDQLQDIYDAEQQQAKAMPKMAEAADDGRLKTSLRELGHGQRMPQRIKQLDGRVPGNLERNRSQESRQPPQETTNVRSVVEGVIDAEAEAITHYRKIIEATDGSDFVIHDLAITLMADEEQHHRQFEGFGTGFESQSQATTVV